MNSKTFGCTLLLLLFLAAGASAQTMYVPQVVNGDFGSVRYKTTFILFNNSDIPANALLTITDDSGNPVPVTIGGFGTASQFSIDLAPASTGFLQTDGSGSGWAGAATLSSSSPVGFSAFYTVYDGNGNFLTESGVEAAAPMTDFTLPADCAGPYLTGIALVNPGASTSVTFTLLNTDGTQASSATRQLIGGGHAAFFIAGPGQLFPNISSFRGTLRVQSGSAVSAIGLRQYSGSGVLSFTSLPVVSQSSSQVSINLAQVANGSFGSIAFKTSFLIFNPSSNSASVRLSLTKDDGSPFIVNIAGSTGTQTGSSFNYTLPARGSMFLDTDAAGTGSAGAAVVTSSVPVGAAAIFTVLNSQGGFQTESGVGGSPAYTAFTIPVEFSGDTSTGIALFNPGSSAIALSANLLDANGVLINKTSIPLNSKNHYAAFIDGIFPGLSAFRGSLAISSTGGVASTILRQYGPPDNINYTTFVPFSGTASGSTPMTAVLAKVETGINAIAGDPDVSFSESLSPGATLSGTITGAGPAFQVVADAGGGKIYAAGVNPLTGYYTIVLPPGTYTVSAQYRPNGSLAGSSLTLTYVYPAPVEVTAAGSVTDMTLPAPALSDVSGTVAGVGNFSSAGVQIVFTSTDNMSQGSFPLDSTGAYAGSLPAGNYSVSASVSPVVFSSSQIEELSLFNIGSLSVGTGPVTGNYSIPKTATISGTVRGGGFSTIPSGTVVIATDLSAGQAAPPACCQAPATSVSTSDSTGKYQMVLSQNRSFSVGVELPVNMGSGLNAAISYPLNPGNVDLKGNVTLDFSVPILPARAVIYGNVNDGLGHALANVTVTAYSKSLTGASNMDYVVSGTTDTYGNYSLTVLSGNYQLYFAPPSQ